MKGQYKRVLYWVQFGGQNTARTNARGPASNAGIPLTQSGAKKSVKTMLHTRKGVSLVQEIYWQDHSSHLDGLLLRPFLPDGSGVTASPGCSVTSPAVTQFSCRCSPSCLYPAAFTCVSYSSGGRVLGE